MGLRYDFSIKMQTAKRRIIAWEGINSHTEVEDYFIRLLLYQVILQLVESKMLWEQSLFRPSGVQWAEESWGGKEQSDSGAQEVILGGWRMQREMN